MREEIPRDRFRTERRDYQNPPAVRRPVSTAPPPQPPTLQPAAVPKRPKKIRFYHTRSRLLGTVIVLILLVGLAAGFVWYQKSHSAPTPIPAAIRKQLNIALYYPASLPGGWVVDSNSFRIPTSEVLTFGVKDSAGDIFNVSEQAIPDNFDFTVFQKKFSSPDTFSAPAGDVMAGQVASSLLASIRTSNNTWLIINTSNVDVQTSLETLCRSFSLLKS